MTQLLNDPYVVRSVTVTKRPLPMPELTSAWRKSTHSDAGSHEDCVEVASTVDGIAIRDSHDPDGAMLPLGAVDWSRLISDIKQGCWNL
jgi:hypothetical protein